MKKYIFLSVALLLFTASCSNNDDNTTSQKEETQGVRFTVTEEGFGADTELTRSITTTKPQIIDAGDCEAEVSIENAPAERQATTRAVTTPVHYTIRAYYGGVLKAELKGTFTPTSFTPDAGYNTYMILARNKTYDFVCFNDKVTPNGNNLDVTLANAKDARIGRQQIAIGTTDQTINLHSKHAGCRIQTQVVAKKDIPGALTSTIESIGATIPQSVSYNPATNTYTTTATTTMAATNNNSSASTETKYSASNYGQNYSYTSPAPYFYFLPGMDAANLKLNNLSGTIFWKPFNMNIAKLSTTSKQLVANGSYTIKVKMKPNYTYLMSDGTTGHFKNTTLGGGTKTPIAVVISESKHLAIALQDANGGNECLWTTKFAYADGNVNIHAKYPSTPAQIIDALNWENGYEETWDGSYTRTVVTGEKVKAKRADFPAFKACADYTPGVAVTGANVSKWYLPALGETKYLFATLGFGDVGQITNFDHYSWYSGLVDDAFTQVGGTRLLLTYWTSEEIKANASGIFVEETASMYLSFDNRYSTNHHKVRPFVKY